MTRSVFVPAVCCSVAFVSLYFAQTMVLGPAGDSTTAIASSSTRFQQAGVSSGEPRQVLQALCDTYAKRYRDLEKSPQRLLSRAMPAPLPSIDLEIDVSPKRPIPDGNLALGTISIRRQSQTKTIACVIESTTRQVRLFHNGVWLTESQWLETVQRVGLDLPWDAKKPG